MYNMILFLIIITRLCFIDIYEYKVSVDFENYNYFYNQIAIIYQKNHYFWKTGR